MKAISPSPVANSGAVLGRGVVLTGAVMGVIDQLEPFQDTMSLEVEGLSVVMSCDPAHCSQ